MEEKEIIIDGQRFVAEPLFPNFKGEYNQTCEECVLGTHCPADDPFGYFKYCSLVKCIDRNRNEGNRNVWVRDIK